MRTWYDLEEGIEFAKALDGKVDLIHISAGHHQVQSAILITHPTMLWRTAATLYMPVKSKSM
jgi:2,4-dienoyl-CoA reductase-like NADH-dependent reductase (Old Yellow Enzyme family)